VLWGALAIELRPLVAARLAGRAQEWEDVIQETAVTLLEIRARGGYDPARGTVVGLARRIAERRCADVLRRGRRRDGPQVEDVAEAVADPGPGPEATVLGASGAAAARLAFARAIAALRREDAAIGSRRAEAVLLRHRLAVGADDLGFLAGGAGSGEVVPWEEVAGSLGLSVAAARQNGSRGLRALRRIRARLAAGEVHS
jgi:DNA-directed RNA polymerase specialized sigma24 family protein